MARTNPAGRKSKLNQSKIELIGNLLEQGNYLCVACDYLGITEKTYYNWLYRGEAIQNQVDEEEGKDLQLDPEDELYLQFFQQVKQSTAVAEMKALSNIRKAAKKTWQAEAWFLERRFKERYSREVIVNQEAQTDKLDKFLDALASTAKQVNKEE